MTSLPPQYIPSYSSNLEENTQNYCKYACSFVWVSHIKWAFENRLLRRVCGSKRDERIAQ
jgi:uncharacterized protein YutD